MALEQRCAGSCLSRALVVRTRDRQVKWRLALALLERQCAVQHSQRSRPPSGLWEASYVLLEALEVGHQWERGLHCYELLRHIGLSTSTALTHHVIGACANHRRWQLALHLCADTAGEPSWHTHGPVIKMCEGVGIDHVLPGLLCRLHRWLRSEAASIVGSNDLGGLLLAMDNLHWHGCLQGSTERLLQQRLVHNVSHVEGQEIPCAGSSPALTTALTTRRMAASPFSMSSRFSKDFMVSWLGRVQGNDAGKSRSLQGFAVAAILQRLRVARGSEAAMPTRPLSPFVTVSFEAELDGYHVDGTLGCLGGLRETLPEEDWRGAIALLKAASDESLQVDVLTCTDAITVCKRCSQWMHAMQLLQCMLKEGPAPDAITWSAVVAACGAASRWREALHTALVAARLGEPGASLVWHRASALRRRVVGQQAKHLHFS